MSEPGDTGRDEERPARARQDDDGSRLADAFAFWESPADSVVDTAVSPATPAGIPAGTPTLPPAHAIAPPTLVPTNTLPPVPPAPPAPEDSTAILPVPPDARPALPSTPMPRPTVPPAFPGADLRAHQGQPSTPNGQINSYGPAARMSLPPQAPSQMLSQMPTQVTPRVGGASGLASAPPHVVTAPPHPPKPAPRAVTRAGRRVSLWWVLVGVLALLAATTWGAFAAYRVPAGVVTGVCADLSQDAPAALYTTFSPRLRATVPEAVFASVFHSSTTGTQAIRSCARQGAYSYVPGRATASAAVAITRANKQQVAGVVTLVNVGGAWWVDGLSAALVGVDVSALATANAYCVDSTSQNIPALYALQSAALRQGVTSADFTALVKLHTTIDGAITKCAVTGLSTASTAQQTSFAVSLTWARLGQRTGTLTLGTEGGAWVVSALSAALEGSDLGALKVADRFCSDVASANESDAYSLFSAAFRGQASEQAFAAVLNGTKTGLKYSGCAPNVSTFSATTTSASIQAQLTVTTASHQSYTTPITLSFVLEKGAWHISDLD